MAPGGVDTKPDPPNAPDIRRRVALSHPQWIGVAVLAVFPILALLGLLGEHRETVTADNGALGVSVHYPRSIRYKMLEAIDLHVSNRGDDVLDTVTVALDTAYATRFSTVNAVPPFTGPFEVKLTALPPGQQRHARIEIQAERYWVHKGYLVVAARADTVRVPLTTLVFP